MDGRTEEEEITIKDVFKYMVNFKAEVTNKLEEKISDLGGRVDDKIDKMGDKIGGIEHIIEVKMKKVEEDMDENRRENKEMYDNVNRRMKKLEEEMMNMKKPSAAMDTLKEMEIKQLQKKADEKRKKEQREKERDIKQKEIRKKAENLQDELAKAASQLQEESEEIVEETGVKSWETEASSWLEKRVRNVNKGLRNEDKVKNKNKKKEDTGMRRLRNWFGDTESEESEEEKDNEDWNLVDRKRKNQEKKEKAEMRKKKNRIKTTAKARNIVGAGPMKKSSVEYFQRKGLDFEQAKREVVNEFLKFYLQYEEEDIEDLKIVDTQLAKNDDVIYIAFEDIEDVKEIHARVAACRNEVVQLRNFVPPQYYRRYMFLSKRCAEIRREDPSKKTQIRFNIDDVEIMMKNRGSSEPYRVVDLEKICDVEDIPPYDHEIKWTVKKDRIRKTFVRQSPNKGVPKSLGGAGIHAMSRTNSLEAGPRKKQRFEKQVESEQEENGDTSDNNGDDEAVEGIEIDDVEIDDMVTESSRV